MSLNRYAAKRDTAEPAILHALAQVGADYLLLDPIDVLVFYRRQFYLLEIKTGKGRRTKQQDDLVRRGWPLHFVTTPEDALAVLGLEVSQ